VAETPVNRLGWGGGESSDEALFGKYIDAIQNDQVILRSAHCLHEHGQYIYDELGRICIIKLKDAPRELRQRHGDTVVAAALALRACSDQPVIAQATQREPPAGSYEYRRRQEAARAKRDQEW
jgi:hypothetical protein